MCTSDFAPIGIGPGHSFSENVGDAAKDVNKLVVGSADQGCAGNGAVPAVDQEAATEAANRLATSPSAASADMELIQDMLGKELVRELMFIPNRDLMQRRNMEWMRTVAIGWLFEVAYLWYGLQCSTLVLAVTYLNRLLCCTELRGSSLQDIALVCLRLAAQHEEVSMPPVTSWSELACLDGATTKEDKHRSLIYLEMWLFRRLDFQGRLPTAYNFLHLFMLATMQEPVTSKSRVACTATYLVHCSLLRTSLIEVPSSTVAAASLSLALGMSSEKMQQCLRQHISTELVELEACMEELSNVHSFMLSHGGRCKELRLEDAEDEDAVEEDPYAVLFQIFSAEEWLHAAEQPLPKPSVAASSSGNGNPMCTEKQASGVYDKARPPDVPQP